MTPKEKAEELFESMLGAEDGYGYYNMTHFSAKYCALVCVEELIENDPSTDYWKYVKTELNKL